MRYRLFCIICVLTIGQVSAYQIVAPKDVVQGDPLHVFVVGEGKEKIFSIEFNGEKRWPLVYLEGNPHAIFGIPLDAPLGKKTIIITDITATSTITREVNIIARKKPQAQFTIPTTFGGNTKKGEINTVQSLNADNAIVSKIEFSPRRLWSERFRYPLARNIVNDVYGYTRVSGGTTVAHKGIDLQAFLITPVYAMNRGMVKVAQSFSAYGNMVVIDHGQGIMTMYLHLSSFKVKEGDMVERGTMIGYSGDTGYANGPHLHVSVRVSGTSIDPIKFMQYFGSRQRLQY